MSGFAQSLITVALVTALSLQRLSFWIFIFSQSNRSILKKVIEIFSKCTKHTDKFLGYEVNDLVRYLEEN